MPGQFGDYMVAALMSLISQSTSASWMAAFFADPQKADPRAVEVVGGSYARQKPTFTRTDPKALTLAADISFTLQPGTTVVAIGAFDSSVNGNFLYSDLLSTPRVFTTGGVYTVQAGEYVVGLQIPT